MIVGIPREIKPDEYRVAMLPSGVEELVRNRHRVLIERGAGLGSGITDELYSANGAEIVDGPAAIFGQAELIVKAKEPLAAEWPLLRPGQILFTYFHFAASADLEIGAVLIEGARAPVLVSREDLKLMKPGTVGRTSSYALCNVTFPYVLKIAKRGLAAACTDDTGFAHAVNMHGGRVTNRAVAETFNMPFEAFRP